MYVRSSLHWCHPKTVGSEKKSSDRPNQILITPFPLFRRLSIHSTIISSHLSRIKWFEGLWRDVKVSRFISSRVLMIREPPGWIDTAFNKKMFAWGKYILFLGKCRERGRSDCQLLRISPFHKISLHTRLPAFSRYFFFTISVLSKMFATHFLFY